MLFRCSGAYLINVGLECCRVDVLAEIRVDFESPGQPLVAKRALANKQQTGSKKSFSGPLSGIPQLTAISRR